MNQAERNQAEVTRKGASRIRSGDLWIFKTDIRAVNAEAGAIVTILDERRKFLGKAFIATNPKLRCVLSRMKTCELIKNSGADEL